MSNKIKTLALLPILSLVLTACGHENLPVIGPYLGDLFGGGVSGPTNLTVWGLWDDPAVVQPLIDKYQEQNPNVTITYEDRSIMNLDEYKETVRGRSAQEDSDIDIVLVHNSWVPELSGNLSSMPSGLMDASQYRENFYAVAAESAVSQEGNIYAVPAYYDGLALVYNKKHFEEIGQRFPPTAWEEFRRLALELTVRVEEEGRRDERIVRGGAAIGTADNIEHFSDILGMMWSQANVDIPGELDTTSAADAVTYYTNFVLEDEVWSDNMPEAVEAFVSGKASMIFVPSWRVLEILAVTEDINNVGVAPVPQAQQDDPATWGSFWMYAVPSGSSDQAAAWNFINYLAQEEQQLMYFDQASQNRFFGAPYSLKSLSGEISNPILEPYLDTASFAQSGVVAARAGNGDEVSAIRTAVNAILSGDAEAVEALEEAKTTISQ